MNLLSALLKMKMLQKTLMNERRRRINQYYRYYRFNLLNFTKSLQNELLMMNSWFCCAKCQLSKCRCWFSEFKTSLQRSNTFFKFNNIQKRASELWSFKLTMNNLIWNIYCELYRLLSKSCIYKGFNDWKNWNNT